LALGEKEGMTMDGWKAIEEYLPVFLHQITAVLILDSTTSTVWYTCSLPLLYQFGHQWAVMLEDDCWRMTTGTYSRREDYSGLHRRLRRREHYSTRPEERGRGAGQGIATIQDVVTISSTLGGRPPSTESTEDGLWWVE
jgi:hypothetical protein